MSKYSRVEELQIQIKELDEIAHQLPKQKPSTPYFFVGPTPIPQEILATLTNPVVFQEFLDVHYNQNLGSKEDRITVEDLLQRSFRSEKAVNKILPEAFASMAMSIAIPNTHRLGQVNGGGHPSAVATINNLLVIDTQKDLNTQNIYVDTALGGAFRNHLTHRQVKKVAKRYIGTEHYKEHIITEGNGTSLPTADELEAKGVKFFFGTVNETSTAQSYSEKDWAELRKWKEKDPANRFITVDITSAVGETALSKHWDIIDAAFFPPQKAISAPPETGFIVFGPHALKFMEENKAVGLNVTEKLFRKPKPEEAPRVRVLRDELFFDPTRPQKPMSVDYSVNLKKFVEITICADNYLKRGGETGAIERGTKNLAIMTEWMQQFKERAKEGTPVFDFFIEQPENRSKSVGIIDITDPRFKSLSPEARDRCLNRFHSLIGDQGVTLLGDKELLEENQFLSPLHAAYDIKTFPTTPLPKNKIGQIDKIRGIRFWLNVEPEKLQSLLEWIEPVYSKALQITLQEELAKETKPERLSLLQKIQQEKGTPEDLTWEEKEKQRAVSSGDRQVTTSLFQ